MPSWGWRLGFAVAIIAGVVIFFLRQHVEETPAFQSLDSNKPRVPFLTAVQEMPLTVIGVIGIAWLVSIMTFGTYVFSATYLHSYFNVPLSLATFIILDPLVFFSSLSHSGMLI